MRYMGPICGRGPKSQLANPRSHVGGTFWGGANIKGKVYYQDVVSNLTVWDLPEDGQVITNEGQGRFGQRRYGSKPNLRLFFELRI